jgi:putative oxidoreductase
MRMRGFRYTACAAKSRGMALLQVERSSAHGTPPTGVRALLRDSAPYVLSILRIVAALLFFEHGTSRLFGFPSPLPTPELFTLYWFAGAIEFAGGALVALGLFTRPAAFIMSGQMAFAYFLSHAPASFFPILNRGDSSILYCFVFFYIAFAGPGPCSLDALWSRKR